MRRRRRRRRTTAIKSNNPHLAGAEKLLHKHTTCPQHGLPLLNAWPIGPHPEVLSTSGRDK